MTRRQSRRDLREAVSQRLNLGVSSDEVADELGIERTEVRRLYVEQSEIDARERREEPEASP